jgi:hypothetical protein
MKVFFTASTTRKNELQPVYDTIVSTLESAKIEIVSLETGSYNALLPTKYLKKHHQSAIHYEYIHHAIQQAHAVIIEATSNSFQLGHEATLALLYNKPVLCLSSTFDHSDTIKHPLFKAALYNNKEEIPAILTRFLKRYQNKFLTVRFNTFINPEQRTFLSQYCAKNKTTASELIRKLIDEKRNGDCSDTKW